MTLESYDLTRYVDELAQLDLIKSTNLFDQADKVISGVTYNSKDVQKNNLFICKGANFKVEYLEEALKNGAVAYISEKKYDLDKEVPYLLVSDIRKAMAPIASLFYNYPQDQIKIIGVGGTKGKTTTSYFVKAVLDEYLKSQNKKPAGLISTIVTYDGVKEEASRNTTPEAVELIKHLANGVKSGLEYFVIEVSSQALKYHRTDGITFDVGIFLNIDEDHISPIEHPDYEDYLQSKLKMFGQTKHLVINNETSERERVLQRAETDATDYQTFSLKSDTANFFAHDIQTDGFKTDFSVRSANWDKEYELSMLGLFNVENAVAVIAVADILEIPQKHVQTTLARIEVPGRTELYQTKDKQIVSIVDYAHNRLSFESLFESAKKTYPDYRIVSVYGAPGGKAFGRAKELGTVGGIHSDFIYITMDDPGYEKVMDISEEIATYVKKSNTPYRIIEDRVEAIETAFKEVKEKTVLLVMGKGQDNSQKIEGKEVPYANDVYYVKKFIDEYNQRVDVAR